MSIHYEGQGVTLHHGDCLDVLRTLPDSSVDAVCTDPPYGLEFMGREWDKFRLDDPGTARWRGEKAGAQGYIEAKGTGLPITSALPAYGGQRPRTSRCLTCGKRDMMRNPHACGDLAEWAPELTRPNEPPPALLAFGEWCRQWALEAYRVLKPGGHIVAFGGSRTWHRLAAGIEDAGFEIRDHLAWINGNGFPKSAHQLKPALEPIVLARRPMPTSLSANVLEHGTGGLQVDACRIPHRDADDLRESFAKNPDRADLVTSDVYGVDRPQQSVNAAGRWPTNVLLDQDADTDDLGDAVRYFYAAKADSDERPKVDGVTHPTVKPLDLMRWLVRLVTPPGGTVLEPFAGSGTTVEACLLEGFQCIAIEKTGEYLPLILSRIHRQRDPVEAIKLAGDDLGLFTFHDEGEAS